MKGKTKTKNNKLHHTGGSVYTRLKVRYILSATYIRGNIFFYVLNFVEGHLKFLAISWHLMSKDFYKKLKSQNSQHFPIGLSRSLSLICRKYLTKKERGISKIIAKTINIA